MELDISNIASQFETFEQMKECGRGVEVAQQEDEVADFFDLHLPHEMNQSPITGSTPLHYMV